jgi:FMN reductase
MTTRTLAVVSAGLGVPSSTRLLADRLTGATVDALRARGGDATVEVVELREHARDVADALVTVTPVFTASYSGLFKSFVDVLEKEALTGKPVLLGATAGTARHSLVLEHAMRPLFAYLRAVTVPTAVFAASEDWAGGDGTSAELSRRITRAAGELADVVTGRPATARPADPFADVPSFEDLLRGQA